MKSVLIIGMGRFGRHAAMKLNALHHQVMAVDLKEEPISAVLPYVTNAQIGDGTDEDFLASLGIRSFDLCIVAIGDHFQSSLETTSLLKELGAKNVVSRAARDVHVKFLLRNGADHVVYPERFVGNWTAIRFSSDNILDYMELDDNYAIFEIAIPKSWHGKTIGQLDVRNKHNISIVALKKNDHLQFKLSAETILHANDAMLVLGEMKEIQKCFQI